MLVVPMMGAVTPGLAKIQAIAIWAMLTPFFFAISSTLEPSHMLARQPIVHASNLYAPPSKLREERYVVALLVPTSG